MVVIILRGAIYSFKEIFLANLLRNLCFCFTFHEMESSMKYSFKKMDFVEVVSMKMLL